MKSRQIWLLATLSFLVLLSTTTLAIAADGMTTAKAEVGVLGKAIEDNPARVNEYASPTEDDGARPTLDASIEHVNEMSSLGLDMDFKGEEDLELGLDADLGRILKINGEYQVLQHWKDKENLEQLGATMAGDVGGQQPRVGSNLTGTLGADYSTLQEANTQYFSEQSNDYLITRKELKGETSLHLPQLPNVVIHAGIRQERRDGMEQSITLSKCNACHVEANGKGIDEKTEDFTLGATGKFGIVTLEYEYLNRTFDEQAGDANYTYLSSGATRNGVADTDQLLYTGSADYSQTPDSEKDSHAIKARVDLPYSTIVTGSFVKADIESDKDPSLATEGYSFVTSDTTLESEYTGYTGKISSRLGAFRVAASANVYEIDGPEYTLSFPTRDATDIHPYDNPETRHSAESREVEEFGLDIVYRVNKGTTLRLGYDYENIDRDEEELGETETHTFKIAANSRISKGLSARASYQYQDIDDPLSSHTGIAQETGQTNGTGLSWFNTADFQPTPSAINDTVYYWNAVYPSRELDATNRPEDVHEVKASVNWSPQPNMSATIFARYKKEENDSVKLDQTTYVPGATLWYAPTSKMNLTMAYTFNKMETENQMCVGWYHG